MKHSSISNQMLWIEAGVSAKVPVSNKKNEKQVSSHPASASVTFCHLWKNCIFLIEASQTSCVHGEWRGLTAQQQRTLPQALSKNIISVRPAKAENPSRINSSLTNSPRPPWSRCGACYTAVSSAPTFSCHWCGQISQVSLQPWSGLA